MANNRWIFSEKQLNDTPSRKCGVESETESSYRHQAGLLIQDMGQRLQVTQLCINTAIVYMHRFYMFHSFSQIPYKNMVPSCIFLAAKVEEQPRKLEHVIKTAHQCMHRDQPVLDVKSEAYANMLAELSLYETVLLQTLGFDITVEHPHTNIVKACSLVRAPKDLAQSSYFLATNSLMMTTMCLRYPTSVVACVCIHVACRWQSYEIPQSTEGKAWYTYVDQNMTPELLEDLTRQFCAALDKIPSKYKKKILNHKVNAEDVALQEKRLKLEMASPVSTQNQEAKVKTSISSSTVVSSSSVSGTSITHNKNYSLVPVWSGKPVKSHTEVTAGANSQIVSGKIASETVVKAEPLEKGERETSVNPSVPPIVDPVLRRVKSESTRTSLSPKDYQERKRLERERATQEERKKLQAEAEKKELSKIGGSVVKPQKEHIHTQERHVLEPEKGDQSRENIFDKIQPDPKTEKKALGVAEGENAKDELDLDLILKPEHIHGSNLKLSTPAFPHKPPVTQQHQSLDQRSSHRHGNISSGGSRLSLPLPGIESAGPQNSSLLGARAKDKFSRDQLSVSDATHKGRESEDSWTGLSKHDKWSSEMSTHTLQAVMKSKSSELPPAAAAPLSTISSEQSTARRPHKKERSHRRSHDEKIDPAAAHALANAGPLQPIKLKIPLATATTLSPSKPSRSETGEFKLRIKSPVMDHRSRAEHGSESTERIKLKLSLKGPSGKVETVSGGSEKQSTVSISDSYNSSMPQVSITESEGGIPSGSGMKLILSKDRISGEYQQHSLSSHHEQQQQHHHKHRHNRHHSRSEEEKSGSVRKRAASPLPVEAHRQKMPRVSSGESKKPYGNGDQGFSTRMTSVHNPSNSGIQIQHLIQPGQAYVSGLQQQQQQLYPHHFVNTHYQTQAISGLLQPPPPPPPPLPIEPLPPSPPTPPPLPPY